MKREDNRLSVGPDEATAVFASVVDKLNAGGKFGGFFPNGIELIKVVIGVGKGDAILSVTVVVAGKDGVPGAGTLQEDVEKKEELELTPAPTQ